MKKICFTEPDIHRKETIKFLKETIDSNFPNEGKLTNKLEKKAKKILKSKYAVATTSGTAALYLSLKSIGIQHGDEVIIPNITFQATANAVTMTGAKVKLADINPSNLLMDLKSLKKLVSKKTKAVIPVHVSGRGHNILEIIKFCKKKRINVIEDAAEAFGSKFKKKCLGNFGILGCFSFAPNKIITTGQGGLIVTNNKKIYENLIKFKNQGRIEESTGGADDFISVGTNLRFTDLQSALGLSQLKSFEKRKEKLISTYKYYKKNLVENNKFKIFQFDYKNGELPLWTDVYCNERDKLLKFLKKNMVNCRPYWFPISTTKPYKSSSNNLMKSKKIFKKLMWLPSSLKMSLAEQQKVCRLINKFFST